MGSLVDSSILEGLSFLFDNTCTIRDRSGEGNSFGDAEEDSPYEDVDGLVDLPCRVGSRSITLGAFERETGTSVTVARKKVILLKGYFPAVKEGMQAVTDDGLTWDIELVTHDSEEVTTSLDVERVE